MNADTIASATEGQECLNKVLLKKAPRNAQHCGNDYLGDCQRDNPSHPRARANELAGQKLSANRSHMAQFGPTWVGAEHTKHANEAVWKRYTHREVESFGS